MIESLPVLVLNPHSRCNCRCTMCDIWKTTETRELTAADLQRQLESIRRLRVEWIVLSGGEPMMHSNLWRLCNILRNEKIRITLLSSGLLLGRNAHAIVGHIDDVIVSLDGPPLVHDSIRGVPGAFAMLSSGVGEIRALRPDFSVSARCTVQRSNFRHLTATMEAARALQLNSISFLAADLESTAFQRPNGWSLEKQQEVALDSAGVSVLEAGIEALIARGECGGFVLESPDKLRRIVRHFRVHLGEAVPVSPRCNAPWTSAVVEADGSVRPCFFHRPIGNLNSGLPLEEILNAPAASAFRDSLNVADNPVCQRCVCSLNWVTPAISQDPAPATPPAFPRLRDNNPADIADRECPSSPAHVA
jgi:MoaA/NifB/PqqE/SkfB family radical SAM enzyme